MTAADLTQRHTHDLRVGANEYGPNGSVVALQVYCVVCDEAGRLATPPPVPAARCDYICWREPGHEGGHVMTGDQFPAGAVPAAPACDPPTTHRYEYRGEKRYCRRCGHIFPADAGAVPAAPGLDEEHGRRVGELWIDRESRPERAWVHHEGLWQLLDRVPLPDAAVHPADPEEA